MNNPQQQQQDFYFNSQTATRSPGTQRHQQPTLHRQSSRNFDVYSQMPNSAPFPTDDSSASTFDANRFDRINTAFQNGAASGYPGFDMGGASQTWNPAAFAGPNGFNTFAAVNRRQPTTARGRTLPQTWFDTPAVPSMPNMNGINGFGTVGPSMMENHPMRPPPQHPFIQPDGDDELIPTAIVIKNIPFAVKKEQLVEVMTEQGLPLPYAFNYHFDNGVFRGLAFANFTSPEETAQVISVLNHYELQGRKLRVEYKKMLPIQERERIEREKRERRGQLEEQHRPMVQQSLQTQHSMSSLGSQPATSPSPTTGVQRKAIDVDLNDPQNLQFYNQLFSFKEDAGREALIFPSNLNNAQRRVIHTLAHHLNLQHVSRGMGDQRQVHVVKTLPGSGVSPPIPQGSNFHLDSSRRVLNRSATTDFSESRGEHPNHYSMMRQGQALHLGIPDSPGGFNNRAELRAAKSHADLRSYTPSPAPSTASFPAALQSNIARFQDGNAHPGGSGGTPTLTPAASNNALMGQTDNETLINGIANMGIGSGFAPNGGSPRRLRGMFSWENQQAPPHTAPIGSNRGTFTGLGGSSSAFGNSGSAATSNDNLRGSSTNMPIRQPAGPERGPGFSRARQNGHQPRSSDEMRHSHPEIIVE